MTIGDEEMARNGVAGDSGKQARPQRWRSRFGRFLLAILLISVLGVIAFGAGFLWFAWRVPRQEVVLTAKADAIVALTGGASRVVDAVELLATGHGRRLLITGVNRNTRLRELAQLVPNFRRLFGCCIDIDRAAHNTIGNAVETHRWSSRRGFRSLVVVTSSYHMPRAMAELSHYLPDVQLIPYPVVTKQRAIPWWSSQANAKLLLSEYVKYIFTMARIRLAPGIEPTRFGLHAGA